MLSLSPEFCLSEPELAVLRENITYYGLHLSPTSKQTKHKQIVALKMLSEFN